MKKTFYEKVGRRYVPVAEYDSELSNATRKGTNLVVTYDGGRTTYYNIEPALAPMIAAGGIFSNEVTSAISEKSKYSMSTTAPLTSKQQKAWVALEKALGKDGARLVSPSLHDCVEAGTAVLKSKITHLLENPAVKSAYDQFILLCELTKDQKHD
ncbi:MAG: hypothetical protein WCH09_09425 [Bacteroidota bacterium]